MDWKKFVELMQYMVDTYNVPYGWGVETHEFEFPNNEIECKSAWFTCVECGEPIYYSDWKDDYTNEIEFCPICEQEW